MIILTAAIKAKIGKEAELEKILRAMVFKTAQETGSMEYRLHKSTSNQGSFLFYEKYSDQAAFEAHSSSEYCSNLGAQISDLIAEDPILEFYDFIDGIPE
ncbi:putative quinol monooxygenase [Desulfovibrio gilichinskyi]|uniref:Quinol monooxygenase YgiN n=1 Tax=Desulfovibrio gilichinskyi TaxID=1519643 RepID=A0A1X7CX07_9BACT|nr:putative quinol monooxygenase [Desulfovibrio gilichinskyi]SMF04204.1 Quinol monooxygenase YgiN [Desulfovibrio gilichinskyi]